jgi:hypothetical protein
LYIVTFQLDSKEKKEKKHSTLFVITNQQHVPC